MSQPLSRLLFLTYFTLTVFRLPYTGTMQLPCETQEGTYGVGFNFYPRNIIYLNVEFINITFIAILMRYVSFILPVYCLLTY